MKEIPDIFIPPTQYGNAGVMRGRNENSGMTTVMTTVMTTEGDDINDAGDDITTHGGDEKNSLMSSTRQK